MSTGEFDSQYYESQFESVDSEIVKLALVCGVPLLHPGVIEQVVRGDESVAAHPNATAFRKLRGLLELHYQLTVDSVDAVGAQQSREILDHVRARLIRHFGLSGTIQQSR